MEIKMKVLVCLLMFISFGACSHKKHCGDKASCQKTEAVKVQQAAFDGNCAMGLCHKKLVKGDSKYQLEYKGQLYYFSSAEAKDKFLTKIDENIKDANRSWETLGADRVR
jgi:YHS domain-containing protein